MPVIAMCECKKVAAITYDKESEQVLCDFCRGVLSPTIEPEEEQEDE